MRRGAPCLLFQGMRQVFGNGFGPKPGNRKRKFYIVDDIRRPAVSSFVHIFSSAFFHLISSRIFSFIFSFFGLSFAETKGREGEKVRAHKSKRPGYSHSIIQNSAIWMPNAVANAGFKTIYLRPPSPPSMPMPSRACEKPRAQHLLSLIHI